MTGAERLAEDVGFSLEEAQLFLDMLEEVVDAGIQGSNNESRV